ncbi:NAD(P)/FAD-dependent oxidoreductase [Psychrosphaera haliotis]|uniref:NAD(P)-binding protein n=1 Tax=Psychrosphaera haliotis TaxID=555083 RepID=A0A6N8FBB9_9GAMM|nr:FAD-dependent oxidoreductase [Psychrosphaera haliotis]MUH72467.1 NAD(P)-binding protein [Psychrosphaera haliotis]
MKKVAIIGSGISGLTSAYLLNKHHNVQVFEINDYIGGHTATIDFELDEKPYSIDTGFIVFNDKTYPNFLKLLSQIGIQKQPTEMSFSVTNPATGLEYNGNNLNTLFAQRRNIANPRFWSLISQILKFNKLCKALYDSNSIPVKLSLGEFLDDNGFNDYFCQNYILPMAAAIWSSSLNQVKQFELSFFIRFFYNHGLLNIQDRPQWYVIPGGSKSYIKPLINDFEDKIHLNANIQAVTRNSDGVELTFENNRTEQFDDVIFACHSDQALKLLSDPTENEKAILSAMPYVNNEVVLHTDKAMLPKRELAWASWNYLLSGDEDALASVTYNMNILQGLDVEPTFCVTLNKTDAINPEKIIRKFNYTHPVFSTESQKAQLQRDTICGKHNTHFAGAYWYNGFHEDGVRSGVDVAKRFGCEL